MKTIQAPQAPFTVTSAEYRTVQSALADMITLVETRIEGHRMTPLARKWLADARKVLGKGGRP